MKKFAVIALAVLPTSLPALAQPATPAATAPAAGKVFSVQGSTIGELLDNPASRAVSVRNNRANKDLGQVPLTEFVQRCLQEVQSRGAAPAAE